MSQAAAPCGIQFPALVKSRAASSHRPNAAASPSIRDPRDAGQAFGAGRPRRASAIPARISGAPGALGKRGRARGGVQVRARLAPRQPERPAPARPRPAPSGLELQALKSLQEPPIPGPQPDFPRQAQAAASGTVSGPRQFPGPGGAVGLGRRMFGSRAHAVPTRRGGSSGGPRKPGSSRRKSRRRVDQRPASSRSASASS